MRVCGIVAEFNPLHTGHRYIMDEARRLSDCDALVIAMSGDYVQRGEPAITDKWDRTGAALSSGADLIIEIPTLFCLGNARQYARAGVRLLEALGCTGSICCGSESGDTETVERLAGLLRSQKEEIENRVRGFTKSGLSYPAGRERAVLDILKGKIEIESEIKKITDILHNSNDILALEYFMSTEKFDVFTVKRKGANYDEDFIPGAEYQSAAGIRSLLKEGSPESIAKAMASLTTGCINTTDFTKLTFRNDWTEVLRYALMLSDAESIDDCPSGGEGLGNALKEASVNFSSFDEIIASVKSKRYTYTRIARLCMQVILGIRRNQYPYDNPEYIRVLGFTEKGRNLLSYVKRKDLYELPIITNINKEDVLLGQSASKMMDLDIRAADLYNLISGRKLNEYSDKVIGPIIVE